MQIVKNTTILFDPILEQAPNRIKSKKDRTSNLKFCPFTVLSLLSDSNQRPRDYKSRALAN